MSVFEEKYRLAMENNQPNVEAMVVCSIDSNNLMPHSRCVNLKYILNDELIFFSNYKSNKAIQFHNCKNVSCVFFWHTTNTQIRINGTIHKSNQEISDNHFLKRSIKKNALAISSQQSKKVSSFDTIKRNYEKTLKSNKLSMRPSYWGGYSIKPNYFEFWQGNENRLNLREEYSMINAKWVYSILQP